MDAYFRTSGKYGKYMMRASAATQVSIDYKSEADLTRKLRLFEKLSPVFMIMMENKTEENSVLQGASGKPHLLRIQEWEDLDPERTGFYPGSFDRDFGYAKVADVVCHTPLILLTDNDVSTYVGSKTAEDLFAEHVISEEGLTEERRTKLVEHFLSMGFFHFRIKKYIEVRVADSVPIKKALGYTALLKGIAYSERNLDVLEKELADVNSLEEIQDAVLRIETDGDQAVIYHNMTAAQWASYLIGLAESVLPEYEKGYLANV
jgi:glutamate--cysteine ligase